MNVIATVFILLVNAQGASPSDVDWPDAIVLTNGDTIFAFVDSDQWNKTQMKVELDAPWLEPWERKSTIWSRDIDNTYKETSGERTRRLMAGYEAAHFVRMETREGEQWIHRSEIALADHAFELEREALSKNSITESSAEIVGEIVVEPERVPFFELWGMHLALASVALILGGLVFWGLILR